MDVILTNVQPEKVGNLRHPALIPVVGSDPFDEKNDTLMTSGQVYAKDDSLFVQLRSGIIKGRLDEFVRDLVDWILGIDVKEIVILASSSAEERIDEQLNGTQLRYLTSKECKNEYNSINWKELEKRSRFPGLRVGETPSIEEDSIFIPGGGFTKKLFFALKNKEILTTALLIFCSEGDNIKDSLDLVSYLNDWLRLIKPSSTEGVRLKIPVSWKCLYGNSTPATIF